MRRPKARRNLHRRGIITGGRAGRSPVGNQRVDETRERRSAFDITNSGGRGATERSQLQHLGIGDAHAHRRSGLPYGVPRRNLNSSTLR